MTKTPTSFENTSEAIESLKTVYSEIVGLFSLVFPIITEKKKQTEALNDAALRAEPLAMLAEVANEYRDTAIKLGSVKDTLFSLTGSEKELETLVSISEQLMEVKEWCSAVTNRL